MQWQGDYYFFRGRAVSVSLSPSGDMIRVLSLVT